ncbi:periplasmic heavy metal sensor [Nitratidesulfovibrio liaohensis]|jgi:zinc resistance-associated protein|uniref:Periplasmic heavy metal sensor n=1 Tax=Nitratidesulfovibrio liaohensis TaxID=2604158 RepID=A0ABY9R6S5_9BACT|nr:periplasmic heavy metal sensor [Nitratidesulfovibrio liaohensis]WMW66330.1 periplasmic heavy metal sensor [Nitratidesulfovibrio liaohensis]
MKRTLMIALTAACLMVFGLSTGAIAQGMGHMGMGMMGGGGYQLSPEKQAAVQKIYQDQGQMVMNLNQQLMVKQYELNAQLASPNPDERRTQALSKEIADLNGKRLEAQLSFQKQLAKEGVPTAYAGVYCPMMGGGMGCPMMGGGQWW